MVPCSWTGGPIQWDSILPGRLGALVQAQRRAWQDMRGLFWSLYMCQHSSGVWVAAAADQLKMEGRSGKGSDM